MYSRFIDDLRRASLDLLALDVFFENETVFRYETESGKRFPVYSVTKSITSAAFSLACGDGLISADTLPADLLPRRYAGGIPRLPFKRFLTMTAGAYPFRPYGSNWLDTIAALPTDNSDKSFHYSNIPAYLVGAALENAVGEKLIGYLCRRLFEPLGIDEPPYSASPEGYFYGATGMSFSVGELSKLGRLYLQKGEFGGKTVIVPQLAEEAVTSHVDTGCGDGYGYFFRVADDHFSMVGKWGQRCMIYPDHGLVISYLSHQPERSNELYEAAKRFAHDITKQRISQ